MPPSGKQPHQPAAQSAPPSSLPAPLTALPAPVVLVDIIRNDILHSVLDYLSLHSEKSCLLSQNISPNSESVATHSITCGSMIRLVLLLLS